MYKELFLKTVDNENIAINHYYSDKESVIIIAHGWFMCKDTKPFKSMSFDFSQNYDVITMDFREHGKSSGFYTFTAKEIHDIKAVVDFAKGKYSKVFIIGFSLGGASAVIHAAQYNDIDGLVAVSAPADFDKIENHCWKPEAFIPTIQKFNINEKRNIRPGNIFLKKIKPISIVGNIKIPSLFIAGGKDPTVYSWHTKLLFDKAVCNKSFELFENDYHAEDLYLNSKEKFLGLCNKWLKII